MPKKSKEASDEEALGDLAQIFIDTLYDDSAHQDEAFDLYVQKVHSSVYSDPKKCRSRFVEGYHTLINELSQ